MPIPETMPPDIDSVIRDHQGENLDWGWGYNNWVVGNSAERVTARILAGNVCIEYRLEDATVCGWFFPQPVKSWQFPTDPGLKALFRKFKKQFGG